MKLKYLLRLKNINQKELAIKTGLSEPLISKFNNYVCLPTPKDMKTICKTLKCDVLDIYEKDEIQFIKPKKKRTANEMDCYKLTVKLNKNFRWLFEEQTLRSLGFNSLQHLIQVLVCDELRKMIIKQANEKFAKEKELDAGTPNSNVVS